MTPRIQRPARPTPAAGPGPSHLRTRRALLRDGVYGAGLLAVGSWIGACGNTSVAEPRTESNIPNVGPLQAPDENGVMVPEGFRSRILARSGEVVPGTSYTWHGAPDGAAVFPQDGGGWIYTVNSEIPGTAGGAGAIRFDAEGRIVDAYRILGGTNFNCAGGPTPWGTWLSCEEDFSGHGAVFECDPTGATAAIRRDAMGLFTHEAVAVDPVGGRLYMTEDQPDGGFYRFTPAAYPDLATGTLEIARVADLDAVQAGGTSRVDWLTVPDPSAADELTRHQVEGSTGFLGGEGIWHRDGFVFFSTKFDNRIYAYDAGAGTLCVLYHAERDGGVLTGVDNVTVADPGGEVLVAEDGGDMQIVALVRGSGGCDLGSVVPLVQVVGQDESEITGPVFDPSGTRLYFSSQRGFGGDFFASGITYEVSGPFVV